MVDPVSGPAPLHQGASQEDRKGKKTSRRGRGKRKGPKNGPASLAITDDRTASAVAERRSAGADQQSTSRKRKRRRKKNGAVPADAQNVGAHDQLVSAIATQARVVRGEKPGQGSPAKIAGAEPGRSGKRRRKARGKKNALVRPLQPGKPLEDKTPAPARPHGDAHDHAAVPRHRPDGDRRAHVRMAPVEARYESTDSYAALDLGTNNCRLLIAQPSRPGHFRVVDAFSRIVRLGEGLAAHGRLSAEAMDRAVEALKVCAAKLQGVTLRRKRLIATEACRSAENGEEFLARVRAETGLELEIINRETEARLAVSGCSSLVGRETRSVVLFDIGGGSSEIAVIRIGENRSSRLANHITHWTSLPVGVVTLSERHGGRDVTPAVFEAMICEVAAMLERFDCPPMAGPGASIPEDFHLIGTSGTVTTLAGVHLDLPRYDRRRVDGLWLTDAEVSAMQAKLLSWDYQSRAANPCIGPDRADLVLAGCAILEAIRRRWPSSRMRVADRGLREGLLTDMMADDGVWRRYRQRRGQDMKDRGASHDHGTSRR
ncbi:Ppx/GppA family phosphatase [Allorhizobium sp. BGMRC 0089]|uniref:Ppx/GppA phosphatase family protein n=1 Tax=Allorhizobium sonneratiae TaxID=2934936 RepID=UPI0020341AA8|nr:Ppx/GppA family phosphatase [Allorhizobium sonneratiae]